MSVYKSKEKLYSKISIEVAIETVLNSTSTKITAAKYHKS